MLGGFPQAFRPDTGFAYCNGGYAVLALLAERASGVAVPRPGHRGACSNRPAWPHGYLRCDALPGDTAIGYLNAEGHAEELRTNVLHLPVVGNGDGGIYSTVTDLVRLWRALFAGGIVPPETGADMGRRAQPTTTRRTASASGSRVTPSNSKARTRAHRSASRTDTTITWTVIGNATKGAWPVVRRLDELLAGPPASY